MANEEINDDDDDDSYDRKMRAKLEKKRAKKVGKAAATLEAAPKLMSQQDRIDASREASNPTNPGSRSSGSRLCGLVVVLLMCACVCGCLCFGTGSGKCISTHPNVLWLGCLCRRRAN